MERNKGIDYIYYILDINNIRKFHGFYNQGNKIIGYNYQDKWKGFQLEHIKR